MTTSEPILTGNPPIPQATAGGRCSVSVAWAKEMLEWAGWCVAKRCHYAPVDAADLSKGYCKAYAVYDGGGELQVYSTYGLRYEAVRLWMRYGPAKKVWDSGLTTPTP